tara:strand:+ start:202 stop:423 length:222 start_codon:yes stop_codon:yes gene_type:complete
MKMTPPLFLGLFDRADIVVHLLLAIHCSPRSRLPSHTLSCLCTQLGIRTPTKIKIDIRKARGKKNKNDYIILS